MNRKSTPYLLTLLFGLLMLGACSDNMLDELPKPISSFVTTYFPGEGVKDYQYSGNTYRVKMDDGATVDFNVNLVWTRVNGNGDILPAGFINDQLPPGLLERLQSVAGGEKVYSVSRSDDFYTVMLANTAITYDLNLN